MCDRRGAAAVTVGQMQWRLANVSSLSTLGLSPLSSGRRHVWAISDSKRQGFLDLPEFITAMQFYISKLISLAQAGLEINQDALNRTGEEKFPAFVKVDLRLHSLRLCLRTCSGLDLGKTRLPEMEGLDKFIAKKKSHPSRNDHRDAEAKPQASSAFLWFNKKSSKKMPLNSVTSIIDGLKKLYIEKLKPLEVMYKFSDFVSPMLTNSDFDAKPMVMLLGQYSTGKTTFIKHLLKTNYPGAHVGPEPTTDRLMLLELLEQSTKWSIEGNVSGEIDKIAVVAVGREEQAETLLAVGGMAGVGAAGDAGNNEPTYRAGSEVMRAPLTESEALE
ncbi:hypothetical protein KSP40_PGU020740 [Platanthera guangdongensis]|uniref:EH domain-containing protein n=1 Tax=Platanthera guangdongensis TaxID=2320717 RepID=A0ABR2LH02_9ASPA